jgi:PAS domain S-box-containing protein
MTWLISKEIVLFSVLFLAAVAGLATVVHFASRKALVENVPVPVFRIVVIAALLWFLLVSVAGCFITSRFVRGKEATIREETSLTLMVLHIALESSIGKFNAAAAALAGSPWIRPLFIGRTGVTIDNANAVIDRYCASFNAAVVYLLDTTGSTVASSNRRAPDSFVGKNYAFRPYFKGAMRGEHTGYFAVGVTSGKRGYYRSAPVLDSTGVVVGVVVVKNNLQTLDSIFTSIRDAYMVDGNGIVFLSGDSVPVPRPLTGLAGGRDADSLLRIQYGRFSTDPVLVPLSGGKALRNGRTYFMSTVNLSVPEWKLVKLASVSPAEGYRLLGFLVTSIVVLLSLITIAHIVLGRIRIWAELVAISEKQFRTIFENAPEPIIISDTATGVIISGNPLADALFDKLPQPLRIDELIERDTGSRINLPLELSAVQGMFRLAGGNPMKRFLSLSSTHIQFRGKSCIVSFLIDITGLVEAKDALETSELRYREITEFLPEGVFEVDATGVFSYANRRALEMFGYEREDFMQGVRPLDVIIPEDRERAAKQIEVLLLANSPSHHEYTGLSKDGRCFPLLVHSTAIYRDKKPAGFRGIAIDLTLRKQMETDLQKKDKLDALGILAGGIAHDFNNLLTMIWSGISIVKNRHAGDGDTQADIHDIENAIRRSKDLTGQLLTYAKGGAPVKSATSLESLVRETCSFVTTGSTIKCEFTVADNLYPADVDAAQISQVVQNLVINAIEAMPRGGTVTIVLRNAPKNAEGDPDAAKENFVELQICDDGTGIPVAIQPRIFDPFFTTKQDGSGLGLATAYSIVKKHGGSLNFESVPGSGTTFTVRLPASEQLPPPIEKISSGPYRGKGRILVMDDEPVVLSVTGKLLAMLGFNVTTVKNGEEAVAVYREALTQGNRFDVVILDLTVPGGMGGRETLKQLKEIDPDVKSVVSSGYSNDPVMANFTEYGFKEVIAKPYDIHRLGTVLRTLLPKETDVR